MDNLGESRYTVGQNMMTQPIAQKKTSMVPNIVVRTTTLHMIITILANQLVDEAQARLRIIKWMGRPSHLHHRRQGTMKLAILPSTIPKKATKFPRPSVIEIMDLEETMEVWEGS